MKQNKELRKFESDFSLSDRLVEGYAVRFNSESNDIGWIETIKSGAITEETILNSDVFARLNHEPNKVLARSKNGIGSLKLSLDDYGLRYSFEAPNTDAGNELLEYLQRGDLTSSSFCFTIDPSDKGAEKWYKRDGKIYRDIYKINALYGKPKRGCPLRPSLFDPLC